MTFDHMEFDKNNRDILRKFIDDAEKNQGDLSGSVIATMTQFLMNMRLKISSHQRSWVTSEEILDSQIEVLRHCIVDLAAYKNRLTNGVTAQ